jgi:hypothetical protein
MNNLATVLRDQDKYEQAEEMLRQVLGLSETVLGKDHPDATGEHEQHGDRSLVTDAEGNQGNYEHREEMHGSYHLAISSKSDHR